MSDQFAQRLKELMTQLNITNAQLSKTLNLDASLISRWLKNGCGKRKAADHAMAIGSHVMKRNLTPENQAWLRSVLLTVPAEQAIARWLYPAGDFPNSCWHIKNNKHIMIHSWNMGFPTMVYSDQFVLVDEFQRHFDVLWEQTGMTDGKRRAIAEITRLRETCAAGQ